MIEKSGSKWPLRRWGWWWLYYEARRAVEVHVVVAPKRGGFMIWGTSSERGLEEIWIRILSIFYLTKNSNEGWFREGLTTQHAEVPVNIMILWWRIWQELEGMSNIITAITITREVIVQIVRVRKGLSIFAEIRMRGGLKIIEIGTWARNGTWVGKTKGVGGKSRS